MIILLHWITHLGLKQNALLAYAVIYNYKKATIYDIMIWTQATRQTLLNILNDLEERNLIKSERVHKKLYYSIKDDS